MNNCSELRGCRYKYLLAWMDRRGAWTVEPIAAVVDGVLHDTFDCSRGGTRCVYGYYAAQK